MSDKQESLGVFLRKGSGQIGYMTKEITVPEFYNLIQHKEEKINVLIDFSPIIDILYRLHNHNVNEEINLKFKSLYNYWSDGKTYRKESIIINRSEHLAQLSNDLLSMLQKKLESYSNHKSCNYINNLNEWEKLNKVKELINDSDMYIETLLCSIHSKASLEIESFQGETVLSDYLNFLKNSIEKFYIGSKNDFLEYLLLSKSNELETFLKLSFSALSLNERKLSLFNKMKITDNDEPSYNNNYYGTFEYRYFSKEDINIAILLRDTLFKIKSLTKLLNQLKEGNIKWSSNINEIKELQALLEEKSN